MSELVPVTPLSQDTRAYQAHPVDLTGESFATCPGCGFPRHRNEFDRTAAGNLSGLCQFCAPPDRFPDLLPGRERYPLRNWWQRFHDHSSPTTNDETKE